MHYLENYWKKVSAEKRSLAATSFLAGLDYLSQNNGEIASAILDELRDQRTHLKLIASENFSSLAVQLAMGNLLTDKYSEGYAHHRFYAGCENVDRVEDEAVALLKKIFGCEHAYVQPHSGADANLVAFYGILVQRVQNARLQELGKKMDELSNEEHEELRELMTGQKLLGMSLNSGGHLTHGYRHNISSKLLQSFSYEVDPSTQLLDYRAIERKAKEVRPTILIAGYSAYPRLIDFAKMREIADSVGAALLVDMAHFSGLVAGKAVQGVHDPIPYAHVVTSTTHKTMRGPRGGMVLCKEEFAEVMDKGCPHVLGGPLPHVMAAKAVAFREADSKDFQNYARQIIQNAKAMAKRFLEHGCSLVTGGTDNHLLVLDVSKSFHITGRQAEKALRLAHINVNRNAVPFDENGPWYTSGIRIGTPALTTLGMKEDEMRKIADLIVKLLKTTKPAMVKGKNIPSRAGIETEEKVIEEVKSEILSMLQQFPLYPEIILD